MNFTEPMFVFVIMVVAAVVVVVVTSDAEVDWELKEKRPSINKRCFLKTWPVKEGAVAEWSKVLQLRKNKRKTQKISGSPRFAQAPDRAIFKKR